jgi:hypothetical protein
MGLILPAEHYVVMDMGELLWPHAVETRIAGFVIDSL